MRFSDQVEPMRRMMGTRTARWLVGIIGFVALIGPWPASDNNPTALPSIWDTTPPGNPTVSPVVPPLEHGPVRVGVASSPLGDLGEIPLAGFVGRIARAHQGTDSPPCSVQALTVAGARTQVTIVGADLLLINRDLARLVIARTGLAPDQIYFTATHTHSGPGGWGNHPLERLVAGTFDPEVQDQLADTLTATILRSRTALVPAEVAFTQVTAPGLQRNRIQPENATNDLLSAWVFRARGADAAHRRPTLATLVVFGAHATISHTEQPRMGGDYPAACRAALQAQGDAGLVLFAAGTVGDSSPVRPPEPTQRRQVQAYGTHLADLLTPALRSASFRDEVSLGNHRIEVDLPPVQVPFVSDRLRFSPAATWWIADRRSAVHDLRLGSGTLVGLPGDCAGHLARLLPGDGSVVVTSFNGDYRGYLVTRSTFHNIACYETRGMSFHGPVLGETLIHSTRRSLNQWTTEAAVFPQRDAIRRSPAN